MIITPMHVGNPDARDATETLALSDRLDRGWQLIDVETDPALRRFLEDHFLMLLAEYEHACDTDPAYIAQRLEVA